MVNIVLIGIGGFGNTYVNTLLNDNSYKGQYNICGLVDPFPDSCKRLDELKAMGIKLYDSVEDFYAENTADLAIIASPIQFHTRQVKCALANGSNVLCEKPLTGDESDIDDLIKARDESGKFVMVGYQWSHSPAILAMKQDIINGLYGEPVELKTIVLWPRDKAYFKRGIGWAGKMTDSDGTMIRDSVANNATAHYLHNLYFVLGDKINTSRMPAKTEAILYRTNPIETFDTALIKSTFDNGATSLYIGTHCTNKSRNPEFVYKFEKGYFTFSGNMITGNWYNGDTKEYGNPFSKEYEHKLWMAVDNVINGTQNIICGIETASVQVKVIADAHKYPILETPEHLIRKMEDKDITYIDGLFDKLCDCYDNYDFNLKL